jgi:hypothetical protein
MFFLLNKKQGNPKLKKVRIHINYSLVGGLIQTNDIIKKYLKEYLKEKHLHPVNKMGKNRKIMYLKIVKAQGFVDSKRMKQQCKIRVQR